MKIINKYQCEICQRLYNTEGEAAECEARPVVHDRGVKVGDTVRITRGSGAGEKALVSRIGVHEPGWGPAQYDHSVFLVGDVINSWGSRQLSFDSYEVLP
jgi:hypothetical protein